MAPKFLLTFFLSVFLTSLSVAQSEKVSAEVKEAFATQYPEAENIVYDDNLLNVDVKFKLEGENYTAHYTKKGRWKETEKDWTYEQIPDVVKDGFKKSKYAEWKMKEVKIIYRAGGIERYRIKAEKNDVQKKYLFFNKEGRLMDDSLTM